MVDLMVETRAEDDSPNVARVSAVIRGSANSANNAERIERGYESILHRRKTRKFHANAIDERFRRTISERFRTLV